MPTITIKKAYFHKLLGKTLSDSEFEQLCFDYGLEVEEDKDSSLNIKVEIPANRYDLLCVEGLSQSISHYLQLKPLSKFTALPFQHTLTIESSVKSIRPFCVSAIIKNVTFNQEAYESFIDFQDKLHHNLGRKRTLVSIGTHDMDKTTPPYFYRAKKREEFSFIPLNKTKQMNGKELLEFYSQDLNLKPYVNILKNSEVIPLIMDSKNNILSMPPIINSELSKISLQTKNIFIDITATDKTKAHYALNVICSAFSLYSSTPFSFELIKVIDGDLIEECPRIPLEKTMRVCQDYLESVVGMQLTQNQIIENLKKMGLDSIFENNKYTVKIPFYRTDILHQCDIAEDLAIGIGYNNIPLKSAEVNCNGEQVSLNQMSELMREELAFAGFCEALNFSLCSREDVMENLLKKTEPRAVEIENPKTLEFEVGRTTLLPGLLKTVTNNKNNKVPFKLFELGDVILLDKTENSEETIGAKNERHLAIIYCDSGSSGFENVHGILDLIFTKLFKNKKNYQLKENNASYFLHDLQCKVLLEEEEIGEMGILHPEVLKKQGILYPSAFLELNFELLCEKLKQCLLIK